MKPSGFWGLTSTAATLCGSKPSHTSMTRESPTARRTLTASVWVIPSRLWLFTSRMRMPTCSLPSLAAAPVELTWRKSQRFVCKLADRLEKTTWIWMNWFCYLGDKYALIRGVKGIPSVTFGSSADADSELLPRLLLDQDLLHPGRWRIPPHQHADLLFVGQEGPDGFLVRGVSEVDGVHL